jgi:hypothetical protein
MIAVRKSKTHQGDYDRAKRARRHQEEALDDALKNTFPASDPVSIERSTRQPTTTTKREVRFNPKRTSTVCCGAVAMGRFC